MTEKTNNSNILQVTSLEFWLEQCRQAGIPAIPATFSEPIRTEEIWAALDQKPVAYPTLDATQKWLKENWTPQSMWRWDCCAPESVKAQMANGEPLAQESQIVVDDPRLVDILFETSRSSIKICIRPIVEASRHDSFPVEFRTYVFGQDQVAVSNYYPQVRLPENQFREFAEQAGELAKNLATKSGVNAFTADFLLTPEKQLLFLEGGPAWGQGAHPCCFNPEKLLPGRILLSREEGNVLD